MVRQGGRHHKNCLTSEWSKRSAVNSHFKPRHTLLMPLLLFVLFCFESGSHIVQAVLYLTTT